MRRESHDGTMGSTRPLIAHVVFRLDYGGLENGVVNLINRMPDDAFRHCVIALTEATRFRERITRPGVAVHCVGKRPGKDPRSYVRLFRLLRKLRPTIVHTRNLATLECLLVAWLAGAPVRIHGEHGWDIYDPDGTSRKNRLLRRFANRFIDRFVTVSADLAEWLVALGIPRAKIERICNGVDTEMFHPRDYIAGSELPPDIFAPDSIVVGSVTRFSAIKDPLNLIKAFLDIQKSAGRDGNRCRLLMIGDGELYPRAAEFVSAAGIEDKVWLCGSSDDVSRLLRRMDVFVLGSLREGISNTILEAMATGLPVVATATGGNPELVQHEMTGKLVPPGDSHALARAIQEYATDTLKRAEHGRNARQSAVSKFSLSVMVDNYRRLYVEALQSAGG